MAENYDFTPILKQMLDTIPNSIDKREGSIIYDTLSPTALVLAQQNYMLGHMFNLLFADTSEGDWLERVTNDFGVNRELATYSLRKIDVFDRNNEPMDIPITSRFAINELTFSLTDRISMGVYKAVCEQVGTIGNLYSGAVLPTENIFGLGDAELDAEPLIPARDDESDENLRERYYITVRRRPYGGNIADYEKNTLEIDGVGAVKIFNAVTQGPGHVGVLIGDEQGNQATQELIDKVQTLFGYDGDGIAPIGHTVTVKTSTDLVVNVVVEIRLKIGVNFEIIQPIVTKTVEDYITNIKFTDETVFFAKLVANVLNSDENIIDVGTVTMNELAENISLVKTFDNYQVPTVGTIVVSEVA